MPDGQIDPARVEGEALRRWYLRTPEEIERGRRAAYAKRHDEFFYGPQPKTPARPQTKVVRASTTRSATPHPNGGTSYGNLYAPPPDDLAELRRRQAEFERERRAISKENSWMAMPALAPAAAVLGLETGAAIAARFAPPVIARGPLVFTERMPYLRVGDNWATRAGRRAHAAFRARVEAKPGWEAERAVNARSGGIVRPDARTPVRNPAKPDQRFEIDLKPDTPSGRRAGARAVKKYEAETGNKARAVYYNPKAYM